ncbi:MAG TPA: hypothetical protein VM264_03825 [Acidimicrobiales bacterium]|nr:hypothetical protein [Acidimicrobiales bacterium]
MILRPHPRGVDLGAWFDGEGPDRVGSHVARCHRCQRRVSEFGRVRSWLRAQPFVAMTEAGEEPRQPRRLWRPIAVAAAVLTGVLFVSDGEDGARGPGSVALGGDGAPAGGSTGEGASPGRGGQAPAPAVEAVPGPTLDGAFDPGGRLPPTTAPSPPNSPSVPSLSPDATPVPAGPLRLGLVVPTRGAQAAEGATVERIVRQRVVAANTAGGVAGFPVELVVVPAEDAAAVQGLASRVDALVGGFGAPPPTGVPWLLPADPSINGPGVVAAEAAPRAAGVQLAHLLRRNGLRGQIGIVVGTGPDAGLAAGLASAAGTTTVNARPGGTCAAEIQNLAAAGATALAIAGDADLAARCVKALARSTWRPAYGTVLAPSAAYAGIEKVPEAMGARTVLSLPWPTSLLPGAARFRATAESTSYRALVSYAATELAIDVARQAGDLSVASVAAGSWRSDLLDLVGLSSRMPIPVTAFLGTWLPVL